MTRFAALALLLVACGEKKAPPGSQSSASAVKVEEAKPPLAHVELPVVDGFTTPAHDGEAIVVTPTGIVVAGTAVLALTDGHPDPSELEGGVHGMKLPRLSNYLGAYQQAKQPLPSLLLAIDKRIPYRTFIQVVYSAKQKEAGFKRFTLLAKSKHGTLAEAPFHLPEPKPTAVAPDQARRAPGADLAKQIEAVKQGGRPVKVGPAKTRDKELEKTAEEMARELEEQPTRRAPDPEDSDTPAIATIVVGEPGDPDQAVKLAVAISKSEVILWSISGLEGTLKEPKRRLPLDGAGPPLREALEEIAARRWSGRERTEASIVIMADGDTPMQRVAEVIAAVRANADGKPLFPDLMFSVGFE